MKRLELCAFFVLIVFVCASSAQSKSTQTKASSMLELCHRLWKQTSFGWDEKQTERAAWVIRDPDGTLQWVEWNFADEHRAATWKGPVPKRVIAQIHTHPAFADPWPSKQDVRVAREIKAPVYTISGRGIWRVGPDGKVTREADDNWYKKIK